MDEALINLQTRVLMTGYTGSFSNAESIARTGPGLQDFQQLAATEDKQVQVSRRSDLVLLEEFLTDGTGAYPL